MKNKSDRISGFFCLIFSVFVGIESYRLHLGTLKRPGPGFLFFWVSVALGIMSLIILFRAWMGRKPDETEILIFGRNPLKTILVLGAVFLYAFFMETLGFIPVTLFLFLFLLGVIEKKKWGFVVFVSIVVTGASYFVFEICLKSQLPKGLFEFLRF